MNLQKNAKKQRYINRLTLLTLSLLTLFTCLQGCGGTVQGAPVIRLFRFVGQETNRKNIFYFKLEWEDAEGDLASAEKAARVVFKVEDLDNTTQAPTEIPILFSQNAIKKGTLKGTIPNDKIRPIQFSIDIRPDPGKPYPKRIKVTVSLFDSQGNVSNKPSVTIQSQGI